MALRCHLRTCYKQSKCFLASCEGVSSGSAGWSSLLPLRNVPAIQHPSLRLCSSHEHPSPQQKEERESSKIVSKLEDELLKQLRANGFTRVEAQEPTGLQAWLTDFFDRLRHAAVVWVMKYTEEGFDVEEFLEGAKDALFIVYKLYNAKDWETLEPMVSKKMLNQMKGSFVFYEERNLAPEREVKDISTAMLQSCGISNSTHLMERWDSEKFKPPESPSEDMDPQGIWQIVGVKFKCVRRLVLNDMANGGKALQEIVDNTEYMRFVRGPMSFDRTRPMPPWVLLTSSP